MTKLPIMPTIDLVTSRRSSSAVTLGQHDSRSAFSTREPFCRLTGTYARPDVPASFGTRLLNIGTHSAFGARHEVTWRLNFASLGDGEAVDGSEPVPEFRRRGNEMPSAKKTGAR